MKSFRKLGNSQGCSECEPGAVCVLQGAADDYSTCSLLSEVGEMNGFHSEWDNNSPGNPSGTGTAHTGTENPVIRAEHLANGDFYPMRPREARCHGWQFRVWISVSLTGNPI